MLVEKVWAPQQPDLVEQGFVAAFLQSNAADTSPNVLGAFCTDSGGPGSGWGMHRRQQEQQPLAATTAVANTTCA